MVGLWEGIPLGFVLGLPPFLTGLTSAIGSTVATLLAMLVGERIRARLAAKRAKGGPPRDRLIDRIWRSYGMMGFGLVAPCLIGAPAGVALGLLLRAPSGKLLFWLIAGIGSMGGDPDRRGSLRLGWGFVVSSRLEPRRAARPAARRSVYDEPSPCTARS